VEASKYQAPAMFPEDPSIEGTHMHAAVKRRCSEITAAWLPFKQLPSCVVPLTAAPPIQTLLCPKANEAAAS